MPLSKQEFVDKILDDVQNLNDGVLSEFFSELGRKKEKFFSNVYDSIFSKRLCDLKAETLNGLMIAFIGSERKELENEWIAGKIGEYLPETKTVFENLKHIVKKTVVENPELDFEEDYVDREPMKTIKNSKISIFDLFATENGQKELAKNYLISNLKSKLNTYEFEFAEKILERIQILSYEIKENKIYVDSQSISDRFVLWTMRNHIKPIEIVNNPGNHDIEIFENIEPDFEIFVKNYFAKCLNESGMIGLLKDCKINKISMRDRHIEFKIPRADMYETIDDQLSRSKIKIFFPTFKFSYTVENSVSEAKKDNPIEKAKPKIMNTNSPVSVKTDETKTFENFYSLEKEQIEGILDLIRGGNNLGIYGLMGTGKTHLAQALKNELKSESNVVYTTGEKFCSVFRNFARNYKGDNGEKKDNNKIGSTFLDGFEGIDILIIDGLEALGGETRGATQNILNQILSRYPELNLIFTYKTHLDEIIWKKKHKAADGSVGYEASKIWREIPKLNNVLLGSVDENKSRKIIAMQRINFLNKKNDLFLPRELPVGVINFLSKKVNPSLYDQIFESMKLNLVNDFSCEKIFSIIQSVVSEKIKAEPEEIIEIIIDSFTGNGEDIEKKIALGTDIKLWSKSEIRGGVYSVFKNDLPKITRDIIISFCVFFIKQSFPKKNWNEIGGYFGNRKDCVKLYNDAFEIMTNRKELLRLFENNIKNFLLKTYGVDGEQISMF